MVGINHAQDLLPCVDANGANGEVGCRNLVVSSPNRGDECHTQGCLPHPLNFHLRRVGALWGGALNLGCIGGIVVLHWLHFGGHHQSHLNEVVGVGLCGNVDTTPCDDWDGGIAWFYWWEGISPLEELHPLHFYDGIVEDHLFLGMEHTYSLLSWPWVICTLWVS